MEKKMTIMMIRSGLSMKIMLVNIQLNDDDTMMMTTHNAYASVDRRDDANDGYEDGDGI